MYFKSVCELDLVFYFYKVRFEGIVSLLLSSLAKKASFLLTDLISQVFALLDEIFLAGEIMETNRHLIVERILAQDELD